MASFISRAFKRPSGWLSNVIQRVHSSVQLLRYWLLQGLYLLIDQMHLLSQHRQLLSPRSHHVWWNR